jgi:type VI protein secretion system component VasK
MSPILAAIAETYSAVTEITNYAALQSDRWLFIASLVLGLLCFAWLVRYFTVQLKESSQKVEKAYEAIYHHLETSNKEILSILSEHAVALKHYTSAIESNTKVLDKILSNK